MYFLVTGLSFALNVRRIIINQFYNVIGSKDAAPSLQIVKYYSSVFQWLCLR
jgi:hypothetical protein